jgi:hypothetical protein
MQVTRLTDMTGGLFVTLKRGKECLNLYELKQHKPLCDKECLCFLDQRQQVKMQWIKDPNQGNVDNLNRQTNKKTKLVDISGIKEGISKS